VTDDLDRKALGLVLGANDVAVRTALRCLAEDLGVDEEKIKTVLENGSEDPEDLVLVEEIKTYFDQDNRDQARAAVQELRRWRGV